MFVFDEELGLLFDRTKTMGFDLEAMRDSGALHIEQLDAAELSPGEFAQRVRDVVRRMEVRTVVIDSLNGYQAAMPEENALILHIHELIQYLNRQGANTFLTVAQHGLVGDMKAPVDVTYLADTVILLRYFEALGKVRRAVSIIKKRTGQPRGHDPRIPHRIERPQPRRPAHGISRDSARRAAVRGRRQSAAAAWRPPEPRVLIRAAHRRPLSSRRWDATRRWPAACCAKAASKRRSPPTSPSSSARWPAIRASSWSPRRHCGMPTSAASPRGSRRSRRGRICRSSCSRGAAAGPSAIRRR